MGYLPSLEDENEKLFLPYKTINFDLRFLLISLIDSFPAGCCTFNEIALTK